MLIVRSWVQHDIEAAIRIDACPEGIQGLFANDNSDTSNSHISNAQDTFAIGEDD